RACSSVAHDEGRKPGDRTGAVNRTWHSTWSIKQELPTTDNGRRRCFRRSSYGKGSASRILASSHNPCDCEKRSPAKPDRRSTRRFDRDRKKTFRARKRSRAC